uniref:Gpi transamidase complex n=1 Tax=Lutzomyia longipalpis TaxID=7200 RepID=A0A1B0CXB3_LUTLO
MLLFLISFLLSVNVISCEYRDNFHEELFIKPLPSGHVNTFFQFTTKWQYSEKENLHHTHLAPRSIAEIFYVYSLRELHVSLTNVLWRYESWGYPVIDAAPGAEEYPPDANHGHYLGSAIVAAQLPVARNYTGVPVDGSLFVDSFNASRPGYYVQIRTESLLLTLPVPDFSMPYNVICLACTVVALAFGPIHNMSTKRIVIVVKEAPKSIWTTIREKVGFGGKGAKAVEGEENQSHEKSE